MIPGPPSSYSALLIHMVWNVESAAKIEPPSQTLYFLSGGAMTLILLFDGAS